MSDIQLPERFELVRPLGSGGMSDVSLVHDRTSGAQRALKRLRTSGPETEELIRNEFARLARIEHDNIVRVFDYGVLPDGGAYFTMEYLEGESLDHAVRPGDVNGALRAFRSVLSGLEALHAAGLVHCDLHASNLRVVAGPDGSPITKILDLGFAGHLNDEAGEKVRGRPGYVAPEVLVGAPYSRESDYYALGATLYRVLTGRPAFPGRDPAEILAVQRRGAPPLLPLRVSFVPAGLETSLLRLMSRNPEHRLSGLQELAGMAQDRAGTADTTGATPDPLRGFGPLVGREESLGVLRRQLLESSRPATAVLFGPPGSGRTRLAREIAIEAELGGWDVAWLDTATQVPPVLVSPSDKVLIVADDIDAWSESSLGALQATLASGVRSLLFVQSKPPREGDSALRALLSLPAPTAPRSIALEPLDAEDATLLVARRLGPGIPPEVTNRITELVGAFPGTILVELDRWLRNGWLVHEGERWRVTQEAPEGGGSLDQGAGDGAASLARLSPERLLAAFVIALWRPADPLAQLAAAAGADPDRFSAAIEDLEWSGVLHSTSEERRIRPESLAVALRGERNHPELDVARRRLLPALVERLGNQEGQNKSSDGSMRASCLVAVASLEFSGGQIESARARLLECLELAIGRDPAIATEASNLLLTTSRPGVVDDAQQLASVARLWSSADDLLRADTWWEAARTILGNSDPGLEAEWTIQHARLHSEMYQFARSIEVLEPLIGSGKQQQEDSVLARAMSLRGWCRISSGDRKDGIADLREALAMLAPEAVAERAIALMRLGITLYLAGTREEGDILLSQSLALAQSIADPEIEARVRTNLALRYRIDGDLDRSDAESRAGLARLGDNRRGHTRFMLMQRLLGTAYDRRDWPACDEARLYLEWHGRRLGNPASLAEALHSRVIVGLLRGNLPAVRDALRRERHLLKLTEHAEIRTYWRSGSGIALAWLGEERTAWRRLKRAHAAAHRANLGSAEALAAKGLAELALVQRSLPLARRWYRTALRLRGGDLAIAIPSSLGLARIALLEGIPSELAVARAALERFGTKSPAPDLALARLEMTAHELVLENRLEEAKARLMEATAGLRELDLGPAEILAEWQFGRALFAIDFLGATEALNRAHILADRCGIRGWSVRIAEELHALGGSAEARTGAGSSTSEFLPQAIELLNSLSEFPLLLQRSLDLAAEKVGADRGFILLNEDRVGELKVMAAFGAVDEEARTNAREVSRTIVRRVTSTGEAFLTGDVGGDSRLGSTPSLLDMAVRSLICVPLRMRDSVVGTIYLESRTSTEQFSEEDLDLLESFAQLVAVAIENSRLQDELRRSRERVISENLSLRRDVTRKFSRPNIIAQSAQMERILDEVERVAMSRMSVLITGEMGTGKELIAKTIHYASPRADQPFIAVNCAAINVDLMETELFGIGAGAASNVTEHVGFFGRANGGTLFLDEIGDMPLDLQSKVLRVLAEKEFVAVRGSRVVRTDFRLVSATNKDLRQLVREGKFRGDLYFRILVHEIHLPPLRERPIDIPILADHFMQRFCEENGIPLPRMAPEFTKAILAHTWEGNVRDLRNYVERCIVLSRGSALLPVIPPSEIGIDEAPPPPTASAAHVARSVNSSKELRSDLREAERAWISQALETTLWNQRQAALTLGLSEATLRAKIVRLGIAPPEGMQRRRGRPRRAGLK